MFFNPDPSGLVLVILGEARSSHHAAIVPRHEKTPETFNYIIWGGGGFLRLTALCKYYKGHDVQYIYVVELYEYFFCGVSYVQYDQVR